VLFLLKDIVTDV